MERHGGGGRWGSSPSPLSTGPIWGGGMMGVGLGDEGVPDAHEWGEAQRVKPDCVH